MPIGTSLGITLPTVGQASWGGPLNTVLQTIITAVEGTVSSGAMLINANLDLSSYGATNVGPLRFLNQSSTLTGASHTLKLYTYAGELYFTDGGGSAVQITDGGAVSLSGSGGITGAGYGINDVELQWDGTYYIFKSGTSTYAPVKVDDVRLSDGSGNFLTLEGSAGMSSDYSLTFPAALPGSTQLVQVSSAGALSYSNTVASAATFSSAVTCSSTVSCTSLSMTTGRNWSFHPIQHTAATSGMAVNTGTGTIYSDGTSESVVYTFPAVAGNITTLYTPFQASASGSFTFTIKVFRYGTTGTLLGSNSYTTGGGIGPGLTILDTLSGLDAPVGEIAIEYKIVVTSGTPYFILGGSDIGAPYMKVKWS